MKRWLVPFLLLVIVALGLTALAQRNQLAFQAAAIRVLSEQNQATSARAQTARTESAQRSAALAAESQQLRAKLLATNPVPALPPSPTPPAAEDPTSPLFKMLKDPKMRGMMAAQQRLAMPMLYADLVKELGLTPEAANQLYDLLAEQQGKMVAASLDDKKGEKLDPNAADPALRNLLGDEGFAKYEDYRKTMGERFTLNQFKQTLSGANALQDSQQQGLLQIISQEQATLKQSSLSASNDAPFQEKMTALSSPEALDEYFEQQKAANERIDIRAAQLLSPTQLAALKAHQEQQIQMQRTGLEFSQKMFAPKSGSGP